jgi:hypothetical protein
MRRLTLPQRRPLGVSRAFVMEKSNLGEKLEKEKTIIEKQIDDETKMPATTRSAPPQESKPDYDLPPVIVGSSRYGCHCLGGGYITSICLRFLFITSSQRFLASSIHL